MNGPAYPPGRIAALAAHEHLVRQRAASTSDAPAAVPVAPADVVEAVIDVAFWASLRREEGYVPRMSLAILPAAAAEHPLLFERQLPLTASGLTRVSPAVERPSLHVGVWREDGRLCAWGVVRSVPPSCCVVEVSAPGLLVVKHRPSDQSRKFVNIAVLEGDQIKLLDERAAETGDCPRIVSSLLGRGAPAVGADSVDVLVELAVSMRAHGRGGSLLVVRSNDGPWRESVVHPMAYAVRPGFSKLGDLMRERRERPDRPWEAAVGAAVDLIAGLTAVDGATVITDQFELVAFGAKIARRDGHARVDEVTVTEPIAGAEPLAIHPTQLGGTRHLSAVQFVHDQRDAVALVASQDGRFTVCSWSPSRNMVHARRVEVLLL